MPMFSKSKKMIDYFQEWNGQNQEKCRKFKASSKFIFDWEVSEYLEENVFFRVPKTFFIS